MEVKVAEQHVGYVKRGAPAAGAFGGLQSRSMAISTVSLLVLIILMGMDFTVSILMIDLIERLRAEGVSCRQAILRAAPIRLRPIVMSPPDLAGRADTDSFLGQSGH